MKILTVILCASWLAGCTGTHPKGAARFDDYDAVKVEQMSGNNVSQKVFAKTIVCLNARRETRSVTALTNTLVTALTNPAVITPVTNQTISITTNFMFTSMTNLSPAQPPPPLLVAGDIAVGTPADTNAPATPTNTVPIPLLQLSTNATISIANNISGTVAPNQRTANNQLVRTFNSQLTSASNNLSVSMMTNLVVTAETNLVVNFVTNTVILSATNTIITPTNGVAYDYFLYSELIPPPDFTLAQGESLILLVDGVRYGFSTTNSTTAFVARKGYTSGLYRVPPEVLVAIANAREVRLRLKGVNNVLERTMSKGSRRNFREFVAKYFAKPSATSMPIKVVEAATETITR